jgi:hypothetical protein
MAHLRIEMIGGGGPARTDQKGLHARIDHDSSFFVRVKVQRFQKLDHLSDAHLFVEMSWVRRSVLAGSAGVRGHLESPLGLCRGLDQPL